jgi:hypothetical protein
MYNILLMYICCAFVGLDNKQLSVISDTCHTQGPFPLFRTNSVYPLQTL